MAETMTNNSIERFVNFFSDRFHYEFQDSLETGMSFDEGVALAKQRTSAEEALNIVNSQDFINSFEGQAEDLKEIEQIKEGLEQLLKEKNLKEKSEKSYHNPDVKQGSIKTASVSDFLADPNAIENPVFITSSLKFAYNLAGENNEALKNELDEALNISELAPSWASTMGPYQAARKEAKNLDEDKAKTVLEDAEKNFIANYEKHLDKIDWKEIIDRIEERYGDNNITVVSYESEKAFSFRHAAALRLGFEKERRPYLLKQRSLAEEKERSDEIKQLKKELEENPDFDPNDIMSVARRNRAIKAGLIKEETAKEEPKPKEREYYIRNKKEHYVTFIADDSNAPVDGIKSLLGKLISAGYGLRVVPFGKDWRKYIPENSSGQVEYYGPLCKAEEDKRTVQAFEKYGSSFRSSMRDKCMLAYFASIGEEGESVSDLVIGLNENNRRYEPVSFVARAFESIDINTGTRRFNSPVYYAAGRDSSTAAYLERSLSSSAAVRIPGTKIHSNYVTVFNEILSNPSSKGLDYTIDNKRENIKINAPILEALSVHYPHGSSPLGISTNSSRMIKLPKDVNTFEKKFVFRGAEDSILLKAPIRVPVAFNITTLSRTSYAYDYAVNPDPEIEELNYDMNAPAAGEQTTDENKVENTDIAAIAEISKWGELNTQEEVDAYMEDFLGVNKDGYNENSRFETEYYVPLAQRIVGDEPFLTEGEIMAKLIREAGAWEELTDAYSIDVVYPNFENQNNKMENTAQVEKEIDLEI